MAAEKENPEHKDEQDNGEITGKHGDPLRDKITE